MPDRKAVHAEPAVSHRFAAFVKMLNELNYKVQPQWHSKQGHMKVICVGAGAAGLLVAYKMKKNFKNYELVCYEKFVLSEMV